MVYGGHKICGYERYNCVELAGDVHLSEPVSEPSKIHKRFGLYLLES